MQQWEYMGVRLIPEGEHGRVTVLDPLTLKGTPLNELGRQGWEVVGVFRDNFWVLLKRPLAASAGPPAPAAQPAAAPAAPSGGAGPLPPVYGTPDEARARALEEKLQRELGRRHEGGRGGR